MKTEDFRSSDVNGVVSYKGKAIAARANRGWMQISSGNKNVDKEVNRAITGSADNVSASELRRLITSNLDL